MITDLSYLKSMSGNDPVFIKELIDIFKDQIAEYKVDLPALLEKKDFLNLSKMAHKAKSTVAVMGMTHEADLLKQLELKAKEKHEVESYGEIITTVLNNSEKAIVELDSYILTET